MAKFSEKEASKKRVKVQEYFWNIVGSIEHINLPKLEDALRREFDCEDIRFIEAQVKLMQTEARIRIQRKNKVWVKPPNNVSKD
jgi:hypothetical protein